MCRILLFLFCWGLTAHAVQPVSPAPSCASLNIIFHGEMRWAHMEDGEMKKFKEILPLPDTQSIHSDQWERLLIQVPPERRSQVRRWNVVVTSWQASDAEGTRQTQTHPFGTAEDGFYPVEDLQFAGISRRGDQLMTGQLVLVIKRNRQEICQFEMNLNGSGD